MKSYGIRLLLLLLVFNQWERSNGSCTIEGGKIANCNDLRDVLDIDGKDLRMLKAPTSTKILKLDNLRNVNSLTHLDLSRGGLEKIYSGSFIYLKQLNSLSLAENRITDIEPAAFDGLKNLQVLNLVNNKIEQLPSALMNLEKLRKLNVTDNPLHCNCATLKLRDALISRGVKFMNNPVCRTFGSKTVLLVKPNTKLVCEFEEQDTDMQADQPFQDEEHGSGEVTEEDVSSFTTEAYELNNSDEVTESVTMKTVNVFVTSIPDITADAESMTEVDKFAIGSEAPVGLDAGAVSTTSDLIYVDTEDPDKMEGSAWGHDPTEVKTNSEIPDIAVTTSSDEGDEESSGFGSGYGRVPPIEYPLETIDPVEVESEETTQGTPTTSSEGLIGWFTNTITQYFNPEDKSKVPEKKKEEKIINPTKVDSTTVNSDEEKKSEETETPVDTSPSAPIHIAASESSTPGDHHKLDGRTSGNENDDDPAAVSPTKEPRKGMGSYVVLAALLAILGGLIGFAAYKGDICRRKRKRRDVEVGTELKDMQKSLLENSTQAKVQPTNGNVMENVPLMNNSTSKLETNSERPVNGSQNHCELPTNGKKDNNSMYDPNDPVKPPRKSLTHETIERIPSNGISIGKTYPVDVVDASSRTSTPELPVQMNGQTSEKPPSSPNAHRVKITLQENPDSVPKTPILITRLRSGENLVKPPQ